MCFDIYAADIGGYLKEIRELHRKLEGELKAKQPKAGNQPVHFFYRGESNKAYKPEPKLFRSQLGENAEKNLLEELAETFYSSFREDKTAFQRLLRAQHYGLPTRLLDVTLNPLVALYFACEQGENRDKDGQIHVFASLEKWVVGADSDRLRIISNLAYLKDEDKKAIDDLSAGHNNKPEKGGKFEKRAESDAYQRLLYAIRRESPEFEDRIKRIHLRRAFFVRPLYSNPRIRAQSGGFLTSAFSKSYSHIQENEADGKGGGKILISGEAKARIAEQLDRLNINELTLFPEMEHAAHYLTEKYKKATAASE